MTSTPAYAAPVSIGQAEATAAQSAAADEAPDVVRELTPEELERIEILGLEPKEREVPLPAFDEFDINTTTFTELVWLRRDLTEQQFGAVVADLAQAAKVADQRGELNRRRDLRDAAEANLARIENSLSSAAINGFLSDTVDHSSAVLAADLDVLANESMANYTTTQLMVQRAIARDELATAEEDVTDAQADLQEAVDRKLATAVEVDTATGQIAKFEERVERHAAAARSADTRAAATSDEVELRSVAGMFVVNESIEENLDRLIAHARADGIEFGGGAYRTVESQIELRLAHCGGGTAAPVGEPLPPEATPEEIAARAGAQAAADEAHRNYVIYEAPSGSCSPPTAPPGSSEHQTGSAIDFTENGSILTWASPGFFWLSEHAETYELFNLPSEAWHWSVNGH